VREGVSPVAEVLSGSDAFAGGFHEAEGGFKHLTA